MSTLTPFDTGSDRAPGTLRALHSTFCWLPITETWIHGQLIHLPEWVTSSVVAEIAQNRDSFPFPRVAVAENRGRAYRFRERALRRLGIRTHLALLEQAATSWRPHLLHSHFGDVAWRNAALAERLALPHVVSVYGGDMTWLPQDPRWRRRIGSLFARARAVLCEGPAMAETVRSLGCPPRRALLHRLGVDLQHIPFQPRRREPGGALRVLIAGSFYERKGIPYALRALAIAARRGLDVEITLVGGGQDKRSRPEKEAIMRAAADSALAGRVTLLGFQPQSRLMAEAYRHHVFLSPSVTAANGEAEGGAPVAIIEMAASGMPVVSTRHCDIPFVLAEPNHQLLVPERDAEALAHTLQRLDEVDWLRIAEANRRLTEREADGARQGERLAEIYARVADVICDGGPDLSLPATRP